MVTGNIQQTMPIRTTHHVVYTERSRHYSPIFSFPSYKMKVGMYSRHLRLWTRYHRSIANRCGGYMGRRMPTAPHEVRLSSSLTGSFKLGANTRRLFVPIAANTFGNAVSPFGHFIGYRSSICLPGSNSRAMHVCTYLCDLY